MNWNLAKKLFSLFFVLSLINACSSPANNSNDNMPGNTIVTGRCANDYYPVVQSATWTYKSVGSPAGNYQFTETISALRNDGFTLTTRYGNTDRPEDWECKEDGLLALRLGGPATATLKSQDMDFNFDMKNVEGLSIPAEMKPGDEWMKLLEFEGEMEIAGEPATATGNSQIQYKVLDMDSVSVPAGTFQAVKLHSETNIIFTIKVQGIAVPVSFSGTYTYWYAKGVGWVKAEGQGNITGISFTETIELQKYNIP